MKPVRDLATRPLELMMALVTAVCCAGPGPAAPPKPVARLHAVKPDAQSWRAKRPELGRASDFSYPAPEWTRLKNGFSVFVVRRPAQVVSLAVAVRCGASSAGPHQSGLAALMARMLTEGTQKKSALKLAEAAEAFGSTLNSDAGPDYISLSLETLPIDVEPAVSLLAEVTKTPAFDKNELERVRAEWIDGLIAERQEPERVAELVGYRELLGPVHGDPVTGRVSEVRRFSPGDLRDFHQRAVIPANTALIAVGDLSLSDLKLLVERAFGTWTGQSKLEPAAYQPRTLSDAAHVYFIDRPDSVQSAIFVAQPFPVRTAPGHEVRQVLVSLLGGQFTSRINTNLRQEHAYTYGAFAHVLATRNSGALVVTTSVETSVTAAALHEIMVEMKHAQQPGLGRPITEQETSRARADRTHALQAHLEHTSRVAGDLISVYSEGLPYDYFTGYAARIQSASAQIVQSEAGSRLTPDKLVIVIVGDRRRAEADLVHGGFTLVPVDPSRLD